jgi:hypothetical protein
MKVVHIYHAVKLGCWLGMSLTRVPLPPVLPLEGRGRALWPKKWCMGVVGCFECKGRGLFGQGRRDCLSDEGGVCPHPCIGSGRGLASQGAVALPVLTFYSLRR